MATAKKVVAHPKITQSGTGGYLLWLRSALPVAYAAAVKAVPQVAQFELALPKAKAGLGDDFDFDFSADLDAPVTASSFDVGDVASDAGDVDMSSLTSGIDSMDVGPLATSLFPPTANIPAATLPAAAASAASAASSVLPTIGAVVLASLPVAAAVLNRSTAQTTAQTVAQANQTAQLQYAAAVRGATPYQTGTVTNPLTGQTYIAPLNSLGGSLSAGLTQSVAGIPVWILALGGLGLVALVAASVSE